MKKVKLALCVSAVLLATSAQAGWQGNWLLGVSAGGAWHNSDDNVNVTVTNGANSATFAFNNDQDDSHFIWGLLAGYQARCNGWLLGAEINVDWRGDGDDDQSYTYFSNFLGSNVVGTVSRDRDAVVGLTGRIGYEVSPWFLPYVRLGVDHGGKDADFFATTTQLANNISVSGSSDDNGRWGFVGGVGAEFPLPMIISGLSLRAEWDYHSRGHSDDNQVVALASDNATLFTFNGGDRHEQTARASIVFNFPG